jgi:hypothetical protein
MLSGMIMYGRGWIRFLRNASLDYWCFFLSWPPAIQVRRVATAAFVIVYFPVFPNSSINKEYMCCAPIFYLNMLCEYMFLMLHVFVHLITLVPIGSFKAPRRKRKISVVCDVIYCIYAGETYPVLEARAGSSVGTMQTVILSKPCMKISHTGRHYRSSLESHTTSDSQPCALSSWSLHCPNRFLFPTSLLMR